MGESRNFVTSKMELSITTVKELHFRYHKVPESVSRLCDNASVLKLFFRVLRDNTTTAHAQISINLRSFDLSQQNHTA